MAAAKYYSLCTFAESTYALARMYEEGRGVVQNFQEAERLLKIAAADDCYDHRDAKFRLACMYEDGRRLSQDLSRALELCVRINYFHFLNAQRIKFLNTWPVWHHAVVSRPFCHRALANARAAGTRSWLTIWGTHAPFGALRACTSPPLSPMVFFVTFCACTGMAAVLRRTGRKRCRF